MKVPEPKITIVGGIVRREYNVPKGVVLTSHVHKHDHMSVLWSGECALAADGKVTVHRGPDLVEIKAGVVHSLHALTDCRWDCLWSMSEAADDPLVLEGVN